MSASDKNAAGPAASGKKEVTWDSSAPDSVTKQPANESEDGSQEKYSLKQSHLSVQDVTKLDPRRLTPQTFEVMSRQATINIGTIGHVAHGKSTVVGYSFLTIRKLKLNITIKLGYANAKIYKSEGGDLSAPSRYRYDR